MNIEDMKKTPFLLNDDECLSFCKFSEALPSDFNNREFLHYTNLRIGIGSTFCEKCLFCAEMNNEEKWVKCRLYQIK